MTEQKKCDGMRDGKPTCQEMKPLDEFLLTEAGNPSSVCLACDRKAKRNYSRRVTNANNKPFVDKDKLSGAVDDLFKRTLVK